MKFQSIIELGETLVGNLDQNNNIPLNKWYPLIRGVDHKKEADLVIFAMIDGSGVVCELAPGFDTEKAEGILQGNNKDNNKDNNKVVIVKGKNRNYIGNALLFPNTDLIKAGEETDGRKIAKPHILADNTSALICNIRKQYSKKKVASWCLKAFSEVRIYENTFKKNICVVPLVKAGCEYVTLDRLPGFEGELLAKIRQESGHPETKCMYCGSEAKYCSKTTYLNIKTLISDLWTEYPSHGFGLSICDECLKKLMVGGAYLKRELSVNTGLKYPVGSEIANLKLMLVPADPESEWKAASTAQNIDGKKLTPEKLWGVFENGINAVFYATVKSQDEIICVIPDVRPEVLDTLDKESINIQRSFAEYLPPIEREPVKKNEGQPYDALGGFLIAREWLEKVRYLFVSLLGGTEEKHSSLRGETGYFFDFVRGLFTAELNEKELYDCIKRSITRLGEVVGTGGFGRALFGENKDLSLSLFRIYMAKEVIRRVMPGMSTGSESRHTTGVYFYEAFNASKNMAEEVAAAVKFTRDLGLDPVKRTLFLLGVAAEELASAQRLAGLSTSVYEKLTGVTEAAHIEKFIRHVLEKSVEYADKRGSYSLAGAVDAFALSAAEVDYNQLLAVDPSKFVTEVVGGLAFVRIHRRGGMQAGGITESVSKATEI